MAHHKRHGEREIKEKVLHTRVPEGLKTELKQLAKSLYVPVSNIVRAVLENALEAAETAKLSTQIASSGSNNLTEPLPWIRHLRSYDDGGNTDVGLVDGNASQGSDNGKHASRHHEHKEVSVEKMMRSVIGFQPMTLAKTTRCAFCQREIAPEQLAYLIIRDRKGPKFIVGAECLPRKDQIKNEEEAKK